MDPAAAAYRCRGRADALAVLDHGRAGREVGERNLVTQRNRLQRSHFDNAAGRLDGDRFAGRDRLQRGGDVVIAGERRGLPAHSAGPRRLTTSSPSSRISPHVSVPDATSSTSACNRAAASSSDARRSNTSLASKSSCSRNRCVATGLAEILIVGARPLTKLLPTPVVNRTRCAPEATSPPTDSGAYAGAS